MPPQSEFPQPSPAQPQPPRNPYSQTSGLPPTQIANPYQQPYQNSYQTPQSFAPATTPKKSKRGRKVVAIAIAVIGLCLLGGGSAAAYYGYVLPNKPENIMLAAMANTFNNSLTTARFNGAIELSGEEIPKELRGVSFDGALGKNGAMSLSATLETTIAKPTIEIALPDSKNVYAKLSGISGIEALAKVAAEGTPYASVVEELAPSIKELNDQWYEFDQSILGEQVDKAAPTLTPDDMDKLAQAYDANRFVKIVETLPDEAINGAAAKHFKVALQKTELLGFARAIKDVQIAGMQLTDKQIAELETELNKIDLTKYPMDVWIDKKTKFFAQMQLSVQEDGTTATMRFTLKDYNADISVPKPEDTKSLMELMGQLAPLMSFEGSIPGTALQSGFDDAINGSLSSADLSRNNDLLEIATALESYFNYKGGYPAAKDLQDAAWLSANLPELDAEALLDPSEQAINEGGYIYVATSTGAACVSPTTVTGSIATGDFCMKFTITAVKDDGSTIIRQSLN